MKFGQKRHRLHETPVGWEAAEDQALLYKEVPVVVVRDVNQTEDLASLFSRLGKNAYKAL